MRVYATPGQTISKLSAPVLHYHIAANGYTIMPPISSRIDEMLWRWQ